MTKQYKTSWFYCNRTGEYESKVNGKRSLKSQGTSKTGCSCPVFITAKTDTSTGEVTAEFCLRHVGHGKDIAHCRISKEMRYSIAAKLAQGVNMNSIMDFIRDSQAGPLSRDHLTTRLDLHNIKHQYNISCMQKDNNDAQSVMFWVAEMEREDHNPILCFKAQGETSHHVGMKSNDFLLGLQTEFQKEMFIKYAKKLVCVDATHGTNAYDFQLITVLVIDDYDEGIPVAWLISNKESSSVLSSFFASIRERCGDVKTEIFMTDDAEGYHNSWISAFSRPAKKLLCSWHVDRSWRRKINEHIKDKEQQAEVYSALKSLQNETSEAEFRRSLQKFLAWLREISDAMATYFEREYAKRPREWASCFRVGTRANTNMFVESFHRTLKEVYLERKQNRRVDHLLYKLRKISRDKAYEQWIKAEKGKATVRQRENMKRHKQAESVAAKALSGKDLDCWEVPSLNDQRKVHCVRRISSSQCACLLRCPSCMACVHTFDCTCLDYAIRGVVCTHIHAVCMTTPQDKAEESQVEYSREEQREDLANLVPIRKELKNCTELEDLKRNALKSIAELTEIIQTAPNGDTIHATLRHLRSAISVARELSVIGSDHQYLETKAYPPNKHSEKQMRFFATKKKRKVEKKNSVMSESTMQEINSTDPDVCGFCFREEPPNSNGDVVDWVECSHCKVWVHVLCDYVEDKTNYICCMCRP